MLATALACNAPGVSVSSFWHRPFQETVGLIGEHCRREGDEMRDCPSAQQMLFWDFVDAKVFYRKCWEVLRRVELVAGIVRLKAATCSILWPCDNVILCHVFRFHSHTLASRVHE